ncbi:MAG: TRAP transporter large permease subunit, partial [Litorivicinaceae bacterium]
MTHAETTPRFGWSIEHLLALLITAIAVAWTADLPRVLLSKPLLVQEFSLVVLGLCLALTFVTRTVRGTKKVSPDIGSLVIGAIAIATAVYAATRYRVMSEELYYHPLESGIVAVILFPLVIESLRRLVGWPLVVIVLLFAGYGLVGDLVPAPLTARPWAPQDLVTHLVWDMTAMVGLPLSIGTTVVIPFIVFGVVLNRAGGGEFFSDLAIATMGGLRGGAAKIAIVASALFGTISGSAVS